MAGVFYVLYALLSLRLSTSNYNKHINNETYLPTMGRISL